MSIEIIKDYEIGELDFKDCFIRINNQEKIKDFAGQYGFSSRYPNKRAIWSKYTYSSKKLVLNGTKVVAILCTNTFMADEPAYELNIFPDEIKFWLYFTAMFDITTDAVKRYHRENNTFKR